MKNVYVVGGSFGYANWLKDFKIIRSMEDADLVLFTGGADIHPSLYGDPVGKYTSFYLQRDEMEQQAFQAAREKDLPLLGICRGAQFLTAMSGGRLIQHQENKASIHPILTWDGQEILISSLHHQAMFPYDRLKEGEDFKLIAWAEGHSPYHLDGDDREITDKPFKEAEIVYYPKTKALCIQGHPEMMDGNRYTKTFSFLDGLMDGLMNQTL